MTALRSSLFSVAATFLIMFPEFGSARPPGLLMVNPLLALGLGEPGKEIQAPLAIVVLGGLLTSTALNMLVVSALFLRYGRLEKRERV